MKTKEIYCDQCDGCGWYEGGPTLKTTCSVCKGTGVITIEDKSVSGSVPEKSDKEKQLAKRFWNNVMKDLDAIEPKKPNRPKVICYCGSLRVALDAFKKAEYESVVKGDIALLPCCMFVDIQREYGAESDYKIKADWLHKRKIDICDEVFVLNVNGYIGESTRAEIDYALSIGKPVNYLHPL